MAHTLSKTPIYTITTVLTSEKVGEGQWKIYEIKSDTSPDPSLSQTAQSSNRKEFHKALVYGIAIEGYYDVDDKEISVWATIAGVKLGNQYTAGLNTGVKIGVDYYFAKGEVRIFKEGNELKVGYSLTDRWGGEKSGSHKILDL